MSIAKHALLFVQGGGDGAYDADADVVRRLQDALGETPKIFFPKIEGLDDPDWPATERKLRAALQSLSPDGVVVAHSIGASAMIKLLAEGAKVPMAQLFLLAAPYNGADGEWGDGDFSFPADFGRKLPKDLPITLWHARDDAFILLDNAEHYRRKMQQARVIIRNRGGHQFDGPLNFLRDAIRKALP